MKRLLVLLLSIMFLVPAAHAAEPILRYLTTPGGLTLTWYDGPSGAISTSETFLHGCYIDENWEAGYALNLLLAEAGDTNAMLRLGDHHLSGLGVPQSGEAALNWYQRALEAGEQTAHRSIALVYLNGWGVAPDAALAAKHMTKLAELTRIGASELAHLYLLGHGNLAPDMDKALSWFDLSVEDELYFSRAHHSADVYQARYDQKKEAFLATQTLPDTLTTRPRPIMWADNTSHASDAMDMGTFWRDGSGGVVDYSEAARWYEKAIAMDDPTSFVSEWSHVALGELYLDGALGTINVSKAISHFAYANEFSRIGDMFRNGLADTDGSIPLMPEPILADAFSAISMYHMPPQNAPKHQIVGDMFRNGYEQSSHTIIEADPVLAAWFYYTGLSDPYCAMQLTEMYKRGLVTEPKLLYEIAHNIVWCETECNMSELILLLADDLIHGRVTTWLSDNAINSGYTCIDLGINLLKDALHQNKLPDPQEAYDLLALIEE